MDDLLLVCRFNGLGNLCCRLKGFFQGKRSSTKLILEGHSLDVLHRDEVSAVNLIHLVDLADVRVIQGGRRFGFP